MAFTVWWHFSMLSDPSMRPPIHLYTRYSQNFQSTGMPWRVAGVTACSIAAFKCRSSRMLQGNSRNSPKRICSQDRPHAGVSRPTKSRHPALHHPKTCLEGVPSFSPAINVLCNCDSSARCLSIIQQGYTLSVVTEARLCQS